MPEENKVCESPRIEVPIEAGGASATVNIPLEQGSTRETASLFTHRRITMECIERQLAGLGMASLKIPPSFLKEIPADQRPDKALLTLSGPGAHLESEFFDTDLRDGEGLQSRLDGLIRKVVARVHSALKQRGSSGRNGEWTATLWFQKEKHSGRK